MSDELAAILSVVAIWSIAVVTPGPNTLIVAHTTMSQGRAVAARLVVGTLAATAGWVVFGLFGLTALVAAAPDALAVGKVVGGAYLAYLGIRLLWKTRQRRAFEPNPADAPPLAHPFRVGFLTNATNPKTAAFIASIFVASFPAHPEPWLDAVVLAIMLTMSASWYAIMMVVLGRPTFARAYRRARVWIDRAAGAIFLGFGVRLATAD
ncbi:MAG: LysE family translocator [Rhodospirillaceae bacterium]|nr:LysE family translocator [Rhodospirillaceae bacterium]